MSTMKRKPIAGHKCRGVRVAYIASCECGWQGQFNYGGQFGNGGRAAAYDEWRAHVEKCSAAAKTDGGTK